ncbi:hypothetical protein BOTBODRAFT_32617 [Botryobasidium botryosum FD-172 SS1]|uniref:Cytochrome b-c1 complex subunit 7 n=1 Tax=Botryobasidium botryosum (strain FD-172 SS1) TaxID=930990 RepID=A0A067MID9_BOTB1|nr:hypothetical protein BOTBODRAFT_32617 [Botryobasidium botryosum FD-172 SS1]
MSGPLGLSLAPQIRASRSLYKFFLPIAQSYANIAGYRRMGLKYDDLLVEERPDVQKALSRLDKRESYDRVFRLKTAFQYSILHHDLPKDKWLKESDDKRYLTPVIEEVAQEDSERLAWDTMKVEAK